MLDAKDLHIPLTAKSYKIYTAEKQNHVQHFHMKDLLS